ncbi:MAG: DUF3500 domain-containing protein [Planctomycetota bacterium]|nr:DUF3500 domain-containing protein [Planctomycetota bacterium]
MTLPLLICLCTLTIWIPTTQAKEPPATATTDTGAKVANSGAAITAAAEKFAATLTDAQRPIAQLKFDDPARSDWHYYPKAHRKGLQYRDMPTPQRAAAMALLKSCLSEVGFQKAERIMAFEAILHKHEPPGGALRDPLRYFFTIFGDPSPKSTWGLSIEGHHISINYMIAANKVVSATPTFLGCNPTEVKDTVPGAAPIGTRTMALEEDLAYELLKSLDNQQRKLALIATKPSKDVYPPADATIADKAPSGIAVQKLSPAQANVLRKLVQTYANNMPADVAAARLQAIETAGWDNVHFAWEGANSPGQDHHYRIQGPTFLIELNNVQADTLGNRASHIHSVWRGLKQDFAVLKK